LKVENSGMTLSSRPGGHAVKKSKFTAEQIVYALTQAKVVPVGPPRAIK